MDQKWSNVDSNATAISKVTLDYVFGSWHHGGAVDMEDLLYSIYFIYEWGQDAGPDDLHKDSEFTARASQYVQTLKGIRQVDSDTLEVYVDYWHFDDSEIASWASVWPSVPWELNAAMEAIVSDGKASFSKSGATSHSTGWLSMIIQKDAYLIQEYLEEFSKSEFLHPFMAESGNEQYRVDRYDASSMWITDNKHAVISNGPYRLDGYTPESRTIRISSYDDGYPFAAHEMGRFEESLTPKILDVDWPQVIKRGSESEIKVEVSNADSVRYYVTDARGNLTETGQVLVDSDIASVKLDATSTASFAMGAGDIALFALSDSVLQAASHTVSFLAVDSASALPEMAQENTVYEKNPSEYSWPFLALAGVFIAIMLYAAYRKERSCKASRKINL